MLSTTAYKYKLGIVGMQETFLYRSQESSCVQLQSTSSSGFDFLTKGLEEERESFRCAINYIYIQLHFILESTQLTPKSLGWEHGMFCVIHKRSKKNAAYKE